MKTTEEFMNKRIVSIDPSESINQAFALMNQNKIHHLPVIDKSYGLVGILSEKDLNRVMMFKNFTGNECDLEFTEKLRVSDIMREHVYTVNEKSPLTETARLMLELRISSLIVVDDQCQMKGIITSDDLISHLLKLLENEDSQLHNPYYLV